MGRKGGFRQLDIGTGDADPARSSLPSIDHRRDLAQYLPGLVAVKSVERRRAENRLQAGPVVDVVDVQDMLGLVDVRIDIERRGEAPPCPAQNEAVIAQVIVAIANGDVERHAPKQLRQVGIRMPGIALGPDELGQFR